MTKDKQLRRANQQRYIRDVYYYLRETIETGKQFVEDVNQFRSRISRRNGSKSNNIGEKDAVCEIIRENF